MPSIEQNLASWNDPEKWEDGGAEWSRAWGSPEAMWFGSILPRIAPFLPVRHLLEIACGHGRVTRFLLGQCERLVGVDLAPLSVEVCRSRFADAPGASFFCNDGTSLPMVRDASVDFAFSWDSLVHVDAGVMEAYLGELARTLRPGACAFLHHSNLGAFVDAAGAPTIANPHGRDPTVSAAVVGTLSTRHGLQARSQETVQWGCPHHVDCLTVVRRPAAGESVDIATELFEQPEMREEMEHFRQLDRVYRPARGGP